MAQMNTAADISAFISTIYEDVLMVARDNNLMAQLVTPFGDRSGTAARSSSQYGTATINDIGETDDLASQPFTPSVLATLAPTEKGGQFFVGDLRRETDPFAVQQDATTELGMAVAQKVETSLLNTFNSLTGGTVGAAGTVITWGHFFAMLSRLRTQMAPLPYNFVCHPYHWHVLGKAVAPGATVTNSVELQNDVTRQFYVGSVSGVNIFTSANLAVDSGDDAYCAMFSRQAIGLDVRRAVRIEAERDASRRGWELNATMVWAAGKWRPKFGIQALFDASLPTS